MTSGLEQGLAFVEYVKENRDRQRDGAGMMDRWMGKEKDGWVRGWPIYPACDLSMFSVLSCPVKTLKLKGKEAFSRKPLGGCFDNSPWKAGKFESGGDKAQRASPDGVGEQCPCLLVWGPR